MNCPGRLERRSYAAPVWLPSPAEIRRRATEIRERWSPSERRRRAGLARRQLQILEIRLPAGWHADDGA